MSEKLEQWMKSGDYLPEVMRDFHDQKDLFKAMHGIVNVDGHEYAKTVNWMVGQCYVIDIFLWFMARRGYTLQRSKQRLPFRDLEADVALARDERNRQFAASLETSLSGATHD